MEGGPIARRLIKGDDPWDPMAIVRPAWCGTGLDQFGARPRAPGAGSMPSRPSRP